MLLCCARVAYFIHLPLVALRTHPLSPTRYASYHHTPATRAASCVRCCSRHFFFDKFSLADNVCEVPSRHASKYLSEQSQRLFLTILHRPRTYTCTYDISYSPQHTWYLVLVYRYFRSLCPPFFNQTKPRETSSTY